MNNNQVENRFVQIYSFEEPCSDFATRRYFNAGKFNIINMLSKLEEN